MNLVAPGVLKELFRPEKQTDVVTRLPSGILKPEVHVNADGILTRGYLSVFAAKFGMAIYREHVGMALPMEGGVHAAHYLNAGLADDAAKAMLKMLPLSRTLQQGKFIVPDQFAYRYNSDEKSIAAALASFHSNLFVFVIATSKPALFGLPFIDPHAAFFVPGELVRRMPN